jgi:hypothetical protein
VNDVRWRAYSHEEEEEGVRDKWMMPVPPWRRGGASSGGARGAGRGSAPRHQGGRALGDQVLEAATIGACGLWARSFACYAGIEE